MDTLALGEMYSCVGEILSTELRDNNSMRGPRRYLRVVFSDSAVQWETTFWGNVHEHNKVLTRGARVLIMGKVDQFRDQLQLKNPSYITVQAEHFGAFGPLATIVDIAGSQEQAQRLLSMPWLPGYKRRAGTSTSETLGVMDHVLRHLRYPEEVLPSELPWPTDETGESMVDFATAIRQVHQPPPEGPDPARARLKFNEALELQLVMALRRADADKRTSRPIASGEAVASLMRGLPYTLSEGQTAAHQQITRALDSDHPASLMLQGDVGSGKTVVALLAMAAAVDSGMQAAFIAPTEVLAAQHARSMSNLLAGTDLKLTLLTGSQKTQEKKAALLDIMSGSTDIIIGTHAVIQESVEFYNLGLVIVDEQHRFGVQQRDRLRDSAPAEATPHMIVMTATPIPRTVAMTMFGDLTSVRLEGLPGGRGKIQTAVVPAQKPRWVERMWERVREEVKAGHQAFVVVPRIDGPDGVEAWADRLSQRFPELAIDALHGRMPGEDKDAVMRDFAQGAVDVLVATTVIEVGVDVPNATLMIVLDAEHFGVSQLHQLRGRVGRGAGDSWCLLHTSALEGTPSAMRLEAVAATTNGFALAELDLQQRTEGDVLGQDQAGARARRAQLLDLTTDGHIIDQARRYADDLVAHDHKLARDLVVDIDLEDQEFIERS